MAITDEDIKRAVGKKYEPTLIYTLHTPQGAMGRVNSGNHKIVGKISTDADGDIIILQQVSPVKQSLISKLRGAF